MDLAHKEVMKGAYNHNRTGSMVESQFLCGADDNCHGSIAHICSSTISFHLRHCGIVRMSHGMGMAISYIFCGNCLSLLIQPHIRPNSFAEPATSPQNQQGSPSQYGFRPTSH